MVRPRKNVVKDQNALLTPDNVVEIPVEEQPYKANRREAEGQPQ